MHVFNLDAKRTAAIPSTDATSDHPDGSSPRNPVSTFKFMSVSPASLHAYSCSSSMLPLLGYADCPWTPIRAALRYMLTCITFLHFQTQKLPMFFSYLSVFKALHASQLHDVINCQACGAWLHACNTVIRETRCLGCCWIEQGFFHTY